MAGIDAVVLKASSQTAVARAVGVSPQAVQQWVKQGFAPVERCEQLERIYGVPADTLMSKKNYDALIKLSKRST